MKAASIFSISFSMRTLPWLPIPAPSLGIRLNNRVSLVGENMGGVIALAPEPERARLS